MAPVNSNNNNQINKNNDNTKTSSIFAGKTTSVDIPKPHYAGFWTGRDSFAAVAARSLPAKKQPAGLPTPPNSISPSLPPREYKGHAEQVQPTSPASAHLDSDIDLQDAVDHAKAQDQPQRGRDANHDVDSLDSAGNITPALLAKHHLPQILLDHGPLAIRHVMGYLTTSVPGFSGIPPAKARRLVVGALEGRGINGESTAISGNVVFEKVGWGRWDAKRRGHPSRDSRITKHQSSGSVRHLSPSMNSHSTHTRGGLQIPGARTRHDRSRDMQFRTSVAGDSAVFSHDSETEFGHPLEDISMLEDEADKMSLDGDESCSSSEAPDEGPVLDEDLGDVTDEEDWASIGAAALRQGSFPASGGKRNNHMSTHLHSKDKGSGGGPASSALAKSMPMPSALRNLQQVHRYTGFSTSSGIFPEGMGGSDLQEREAIEALVKLSSV
ncbi:DNA-binding proteins Bright/BRCAA1/RBP1 and proteins containing BRIGHT domain [Toensbergia leucococca]|nr:DNA-binding proteins Bright/BRCAA1/RBP1 and proteins containing BRIGHT domain [Toensbergia leucococca]